MKIDMRHRTLACCLVLLSATQEAHSEESFKPLLEIIEDEASLVTMTHATERCTAIYQTLAGRARNRTDNSDGEAFAIQADELGMEFFQYAVHMRHMYNGREDSDIGLSLNEAIEMVQSQAYRYASLMNEEYLRSGNSISREIQSDMDACMMILNFFR